MGLLIIFQVDEDVKRKVIGLRSDRQIPVYHPPANYTFYMELSEQNDVTRKVTPFSYPAAFTVPRSAAALPRLFIKRREQLILTD